ncbi:3'(2'),5'-bisphosphate nucleotidase CysQ [Bartonella henselae]|uniref:3'(2'),5'-bisphosphate nucleotidase CysQ n=1 Tax=Bartonella henselae TaxID=38323 RepID=UPI0009684F0E|nr:3'(2'),5'-bisphosphate nucleotidase CysQ [Bartonella henselae]OLL56131.1 3'(2'),5'-bisphosphate nucleotidase CysQ [Bartonella henselae]OLL56702.1 3'(2'),5'-bisphosphate nucleotidase CysQ [Bartonella henselae]UJM32665.1 3'(2'),5'-bisphosphate nucleotidase CysQ [Bartonella henselae]
MQENNTHHSSDLNLLLDVCREAGNLAMKYFGCELDVWIKEGNSPVSEADLAVDHFLKERLLVARPNYGWISEETKDNRSQRSYERSFVVDPIDGTRGFLSGSTYWCVSIAIIENGRPIIGVVQCPAQGNVYAAVTGEGATLNGIKLPLLPSQVNRKYKVSLDKSLAQKLPDDFCNQVSFYRHIPSLAYRIVLVAQGEIDIVLIRPNCHAWDIAAADLILQECGGYFLPLDASFLSYGIEPYQYGFLVAGKNNCCQNMIDVVRQAKLV